MEEVKVKKISKIKILIYLLISIFVCLYFAGKTGYYENKIHKDTVLTKEAIIEFEKDVADGKAVDLKDYINPNDIDFQNKYSTLGYNISNSIDKLLNDGVNYLVEILKALFT